MRSTRQGFKKTKPRRKFEDRINKKTLLCVSWWYLELCRILCTLRVVWWNSWDTVWMWMTNFINCMPESVNLCIYHVTVYALSDSSLICLYACHTIPAIDVFIITFFIMCRWGVCFCVVFEQDLLSRFSSASFLIPFLFLQKYQLRMSLGKLSVKRNFVFYLSSQKRLSVIVVLVCTCVGIAWYHWIIQPLWIPSSFFYGTMFPFNLFNPFPFPLVWLTSSCLIETCWITFVNTKSHWET